MKRKIMRAETAAFCAALLCCTAAFAGDNTKLFPRYEADYYKTGNPSAIASGQIAMQGKPEEIILKNIPAANGTVQQTTILAETQPTQSGEEKLRELREKREGKIKHELAMRDYVERFRDMPPSANVEISATGGEDEQKAQIEKAKRMIVESYQQPQEESHYVEKEIAEQWREEHRQEQAVGNVIRVINMFQR